ncbi:hypothetical protein ENHY17A_100295 [Moraxellaceae bacterium 17A]|nr:hypothetical protein ENHY17A_100295 [Moraxellaceae bacterium 17A]
MIAKKILKLDLILNKSAHFKESFYEKRFCIFNSNANDKFGISRY